MYGLETISLRYFYVFGSRQDPASRYAAVIPRFIQLALEGKPLEIHGDGLQSRDFTYISNVVEANILAAKAKDARGEVINIACGERHTVSDIVHHLEEILGKNLEYSHTTARKGDVRHTMADISKAREILGYNNYISFVNGLKQTVEYFKE